MGGCSKRFFPPSEARSSGANAKGLFKVFNNCFFRAEFKTHVSWLDWVETQSLMQADVYFHSFLGVQTATRSVVRAICDASQCVHCAACLQIELTLTLRPFVPAAAGYGLL